MNFPHQPEQLTTAWLTDTFDQCWDDYRLVMFELLRRKVLGFAHRIVQGTAYTEWLEVCGPRVYAAVVELYQFTIDLSELMYEVSNPTQRIILDRLIGANPILHRISL